MKAFLILMTLVLAGCDKPRFGRGEIVCLLLDDQMAMVLSADPITRYYTVRMSRTGQPVDRVSEFELKPCDQFSLTP